MVPLCNTIKINELTERIKALQIQKTQIA